MTPRTDPSPHQPDDTGETRAAGAPIRWGTAATSSGTLGLSPRSDWSRWEADGRLPRSRDGSGFGVDFATDLELLAELGLTTLRWGLDWARLEPWPGRWDTDAADMVTEVLQAARRVGVDVWAVLHEGPLPGWFSEDEGGFGSDEGRRRTWPRHVDRVAEAFGDLVAGWVPVLDPYTRAAEGHLHGTRPPGGRDPEAFVDTLRDLHLVSHEAWRLLRSGEPPVATCIDVAPLHPDRRSRHPEERAAAVARAGEIDRLRSGMWARALTEGLLATPGRGEFEVAGLAGAYDVIGFTFRGARTVFADGTTGPYPADAPVAADGTAPWPEELGVAVRRLAEQHPGRPLALLGTGLVASEDDWRTEVAAGTVAEVRGARADGLPLGLALWETGIDGWNPITGLDVPDGLVDRARHPRLSAAVLATAAGRRPPA
ncbi:family 1 glycosylhydrolase [Rhabdothermincola salaria]|uniref:family 1 glycosylhydrolase n=1 Tax=Rhabdothermincola salaria TaxID=2903142 RepID=UPI001E54221E|nr:family 1 glycosylhydrolase [Rhabdothermincola salaria]